MSEHKQEADMAMLRREACELQKEIAHVEGAIRLLTADLTERNAELTTLHEAFAALRNEVSAMHADAALRRSLRREVAIKVADLDLAIADSSASTADRALLRQQLVHLWTLADRAIGGGE